MAWTHRERAAGRYACFGVVPRGMHVAVGLCQVRRLEPSFRRAEWGFVIGAEFWGSGLFLDAAPLVVSFALEIAGAERLEARMAVENARANGALARLGAIERGILPASLLLAGGEYVDQRLWTIDAADWQRRFRADSSPLSAESSLQLDTTAKTARASRSARATRWSTRACRAGRPSHKASSCLPFDHP